MLSEPLGKRFSIERVVTDGHCKDVGFFDGVHGDGTTGAFGDCIAENQIGDEFGDGRAASDGLGLLLLWLPLLLPLRLGLLLRLLLLGCIE